MTNKTNYTGIDREFVNLIYDTGYKLGSLSSSKGFSWQYFVMGLIMGTTTGFLIGAGVILL